MNILFALFITMAIAALGENTCDSCCKKKFPRGVCKLGRCYRSATEAEDVFSVEFPLGFDKCTDFWNASWKLNPNSQKNPGECRKPSLKVDGICICQSTFSFPYGLTTRWHGLSCSNSYNTTFWDGNLVESGEPAATYGRTCTSCRNGGKCGPDGSCICPSSKRNIAGGFNHTYFYGVNCENYYYIWKTRDISGVVEDTTKLCYCNNSSGCTSVCDDKITCNNNGKCNGKTCKCNANFDGPFCSYCKFGFTGASCDKCEQGFYPEGKCNVKCFANDTQFGCNSHGTCDSQGKCSCVGGFDGESCLRCKSSSNITVYNSTLGCQIVCDRTKTCKSKGFCDLKGKCVCESGYSGENCASGVAGGAAGAAGECKKKSPLLSVIIAILVTLLVMGLAFGAYKLWEMKKASKGPAKQSNWTDFEKDSSTAYSQL